MNTTTHRKTLLNMLLGAALFASLQTQAAGIAPLDIAAAGKEPALKGMVWTPCAQGAGTVQVGIFSLSGKRDCPVAGSNLPLVVISHGKGGSMLGHHDTAAALADAGFVVASISHPGDSFGDDGATEKLKIFESRPRDISRLISHLTERWPQRAQLNGKNIGVFGFSRGGYTALSLVGGVPNASASANRFCDAWWSFVIPMCRQLNDDGAQLRPQVDPRIRAAVVVDPLNLFNAAGLKTVRTPVQLWASELGGDAVALPHIQAIKAALPATTEYYVAQGASHFAYLAPCPAELAKSAEEICVDPKGFDRVAWHQKLNAAVVRFFQKQLGSTGS